MIKYAERLEGIDGRLSRLVEYVGRQGYPLTVVEGLRTQERQQYLYDIGRSWTLRSKHLQGRAVDLVPSATGWDDDRSLCVLAGLMLGGAHALDIALRWGGDWNRDWTLNTKRKWDAAHFELLED